MRLSLQLYTVRDNLAKDFRGTLERVREIGFEYVEGVGGSGDAETLKKTFDELGLKVNGVHTGIDSLENDLEGAIRDAKTLECPFLIVPWVGDDRRGDWASFGRHLNEIGKKVSDSGLSLAYHNHEFEFVGDGLSALYANSDPGLLKAELDLAWVNIGGGDPVEWIRRMGSRAPLLHLKDYDPSKDPQWQPAGQGIMDWDSVLAAAKDTGAQFGVVELDSYAGDPLDAAAMSFEYFKDKGLS